MLPLKINKYSLESSNVLFDSASFIKIYTNFLSDRKFVYHNIYCIVRVQEIILSFNNINLSTSLHGGLIANFFFLKMFTGKQPFFLPVRVVSSFKHKSYSFICVMRLSKQEASCFFFKKIVYASTNLSVNDFGIYHHNMTSTSLTFFIKNFPYLRVVETHPVFFKWAGCLDITIKFSSNFSKIELYHFLSILKIQNKYLTSLLL